MEGTRGHPDARSSSRHRVTYTRSSGQGREFFRRLKTVDSRGSACLWKWQPGCFDRLLRSDEPLHEKWSYLQENPVRPGLLRIGKIGRIDSDWVTMINRGGNHIDCRCAGLASGALALQELIPSPV